MVRRKVCAVAVVLLGACAGSANAEEYFGSGGPIADGPGINDPELYTETVFPINVSGTGGNVTSVNAVTLVNIQHPFFGDLEFLLRGPDGSTALLVDAP